MSILSMSVMIAYATQKTIIVNDDETVKETAEAAVGSVNWSIDTKNLTDNKSDVLKVFVPSDATSSSVGVSTRYDLKTVSVKI